MTRQLALSPYLAGEAFAAADISMKAMIWRANAPGGVVLGKAEQVYVARHSHSARTAYKRAMETRQRTEAWAAAAEAKFTGAG